MLSTVSLKFSTETRRQIIEQRDDYDTNLFSLTSFYGNVVTR